MALESQSTTLANFRIGEFSTFSFFKVYYIAVLKENWDFISKIKELNFIEADRQALALFDDLEEDARQKYIIEVSTDTHETHHFHQYMLLPTGTVMFQLFWPTIELAFDLYRQLKKRIQENVDPFSRDTIVVYPAGLMSLVDYYISSQLPPGAIDRQCGTNPLTHEYSYKHEGSSGKLPNKLPTVKISGRLYPLGLGPILESWTWALTRALVSRQFPRNYYDWYESTKNSDDMWHYTLLDKIFESLFGNAYLSLDPIAKHKATAQLAICSCSINPKFTDDFFQRQDSHPGWTLTILIESLWQNRDLLVHDQRLDVEMLCKTVYRTKKLFNDYSLADRLCELDIPAKDTSLQERKDLVGFIQRYWFTTQYHTAKEFLNNNNCFLDAAEYLTCKQRDFLPRIPIAIAQRPGASRFHMAFPTEQDRNQWFTWFFITQLYFNLMSGKKVCPIARYSLEIGCSMDSSCLSLSSLLRKGDKCHLVVFLRDSKL